MKAISALVLLFLLHSTSLANERWYQVELLVFANNSSQGLISEHWRTPPPFEPQFQSDIKSLQEMIADSHYAFEDIAEIDKQLAGNAKTMDGHWQYRPLLYVGWKQAFTRDAEAIPVYLDNEVVVKEVDPFLAKATELSQQYGGSALSTESAIENPVTELGSDASISINANDNLSGVELKPLYELSGTAAVTLRRYLHLKLDLQYNRLVADKDTDQVKAVYDSLESEYLSFDINETRRMRSKQPHYFDHPAFGVIALITPIEKTPQSNQLEIETLPIKDSNAVETQALEQ